MHNTDIGRLKHAVISGRDEWTGGATYKKLGFLVLPNHKISTGFDLFCNRYLGHHFTMWTSRLLVPFICLYAPFAHATQRGATGNSTVRTYHVAAVEVDWDYMPRLVNCWYKPKEGIALTTHSGMDNINGVPIKESPQAAAVASNNGQRIGHSYKKALFREYTDGSFTQQSARPEVSNIWIEVRVEFC